jgi:transposase
LEAPDLGNEDGVMGEERTAGKPTTKRYSPEEKARAVRLVRQLRRELGTSHGTIQRVAEQIGCGTESLRTWVKQADIDEGVEPGTTTAEQRRIKELEQRVRELERSNDLLKRASAFFAAELDRPSK